MKRMLINATHAEELRVAIVDGQKLIDIDIETAGREQRKGNIYKAVVTRVEPSLEACFVNYGEERHGFLPFKEIERSFFKAGVDPRGASIKDAISEGQELIIQVEKEERGNKGAALTTFISLAGRYLVLMPNNPRGGGVSRRIEGEERQELREAMSQLEIPQGMSIIARTAGIGRSAEELQHDMDYLMRLWSAIDGAAQVANDTNGTRLNPAPFLIIEESSLEIRAIRDYFSPDIGEILVDNATIAEQARGFMTHVMPHMANRVKHYTDDIPLYSRFQIEHQIETAYSRTVPLPSGGAIVIDHTEALVSVDVNSARATRGSDIEDTAFRTNVEAAEEVARQLRLRDLGGLVVIDFIDMESSKNQKEVESRLKDALHYDRARVQMGKISRFGLMELSRQRLRPSLSEGSHTTCPRCNGTGVIRDIESSALHILRIVQEEAMKEQTAALNVQVPVDVATYLLNEKRAEIHLLETRTKTDIVLIPNKYLETPHYKLDRLRQDDERLDLVQASYEQVEKPSEDVEYAKKEAANRQEPVVKGIVPDTPAPMPVEKPVAVAAAPVVEQKGFFARIKSWFAGEPEPVAVVEEETKKPARSNGNGRNAHNNRNRSETRNASGNRNNERRNNRHRTERKDGETETVATPEAAPRKENERRERGGRNKNERKENVVESTAAAVEVREPREPRNNRNRNERKETAVDAAPAEEVVSLVVLNEGVTDAPAVAESGEQPPREKRERRSRGGRDRRERRERRDANAVNGEGTPEMSATANTISHLLRDDEVLDHTPITIQVGVPVTTQFQVAAPVAVDTSHTFAAIIADEADNTAIAPVELTMVNAPVVIELVAETPPIEQVQASLFDAQTSVATLTADAETAVEATHQQINVVAEAMDAAQVELTPVASLDEVLNQVGLQLVQTSASTEPFVMAPPLRNHPPRERKPRATVADEPLQIVETQN
jgi:ribonuclease E